MTIVFFDGFDTYKIGMTDAYNNGISLTEKWSCGSTTTLSGGFMTLGQAGAFLPGTPPGQYLLSNATDGNNNRLIANIAPSTNICVGFHYSPTITIGANNNIVTLYNSGSVTDATVIQLITTSSNYLAVRVAWPLAYFNLVQNGSNYDLYVQSNANGLASTGNARWDYDQVQANTWYKVGLMWYNIGGTLNPTTLAYTGGVNYIRGYLDDVIKFDIALDGTAKSSGYAGVTNPATAVKIPYVNTNSGISIGCDYVNVPSLNFRGQMRNIYVGRTLLWPI